MRASLSRLDRRAGQHPGLLLERYFTTRDVTSPRPEDRRALLDAVVAASRDPQVLALYRMGFEGWANSLPPVTEGGVLATPPFARLIVGLGQESVLETGLRLHHTYGTPVIPGSGLKGLASHYCHTVWGQVHDPDAADENRRYRRDEPAVRPEDNYHRFLFGTTEDGGAITFHDAWITPESLSKTAAARDQRGVLPDVTTPHHPKWQDGSVPPTDFDSPVPVAFLSVAGAFRVAVSWNGPPHDAQQNWTELAFTLLKESLWEWGVGGKTSSGYGRLGDADRIAETVARPRAVAARPAGPPAKRNAGVPARVKVLGPRPKGGYEVQEEGRPKGVLNLGLPAGLTLNAGDEVSVQVAVDDPKNPQYKWPPAAPAGGRTDEEGQ